MGGLSHLACGGGIAEELQDPGDQLRGVTNLVRHPLDQEGLSHFGKIVHIRSKQNGPPIPSRFKDIVTPHRDQAPPHKDDRRQSIELAQLSHGIDDNDRRKLGIPFSELASADKRKSRLLKKTPHGRSPGPVASDPLAIVLMEIWIHRYLSTKDTVRSAAPRFLMRTRWAASPIWLAAAGSRKNSRTRATSSEVSRTW